jgi:hypothetical protein
MIALSDRQADVIATLNLRGLTEGAVERDHAPLVLYVLERLGLVERRSCGGLDVLWHPTATGRDALRAHAAVTEDVR